MTKTLQDIINNILLGEDNSGRISQKDLLLFSQEIEEIMNSKTSLGETEFIIFCDEEVYPELDMVGIPILMTEYIN